MKTTSFSVFLAITLTSFPCDVIADFETAVSQLSDLHHPVLTTSDRFGDCVATNGNQIAVGVPRRNEVIVFDAVSSGLLGVIAPDPEEVHENALFGAALAFSGSTLIVGAPQDNRENGARPGGVLREGSIHFCNLADLSPDAPLMPFRESKPKEGQMDLWFGYALAANETHVVVGAPNFSSGTVEPDTGSAYLYRVDTGAFVSGFEFEDLAGGDDRSGSSVAIGADHIVIGCPGYELPGAGRLGSNSGRVLVYRIDDSTLVRNWVNPEPESRDSFGESIAIEGTRVIVGAPGKDDDDSGEDAGAAFIFDIGNDNLVAKFVPSGSNEEHEDANAGTSVAIMENTGYVSAPGWQGDGFSDAGTVFAIDLESGNCTGRYRLAPGISGSHLGGDNFNAVINAVGEDVPTGGKLAAGGSVLVVGAPAATVDGDADAGSAYIFSLTETASEVFEVTQIEFDRANVLLTWTSSSAGTFDVEWSEDAQNWEPVRNNSGLTLPFGPQTRQLNSLAPKDDLPRAFFRVKRTD